MLKFVLTYTLDIRICFKKSNRPKVRKGMLFVKWSLLVPVGFILVSGYIITRTCKKSIRYSKVSLKQSSMSF